MSQADRRSHGYITKVDQFIQAGAIKYSEPIAVDGLKQ